MGLDIMVVKEDYGFRVGSYSYFNDFREEVARVVGFNLNEMVGFGGTIKWGDQAFKELINHSDCDGILDSADCDSLTEDFKKYDERMKEWLSEEHYTTYTELMEAINKVADEEAVSIMFH